MFLKPLKKAFAIALALILVLSTEITTFAATFTNARTITIISIEGRNAEMWRSTGTPATPRQNTRLTNGYQIATGARTHINMRMDRQSIVRMDENTRVAVDIYRQLLGLTVVEGSSLVQVAEQARNQSIMARVGSVVLAVRGTMFTIGHFDDNTVYVVMLSGAGEVDGIMLEDGQILTAWHDGESGEVLGAVLHDWTDYETSLIISQIILEELDFFTLEEILNNREYLLENSNFITEELLEEVEELADALRPEPIDEEDEEEETAVVENTVVEDDWNDWSGGDSGYDDNNGGFSPTPNPTPTPELPITPPNVGRLTVEVNENMQVVITPQNPQGGWAWSYQIVESMSRGGFARYPGGSLEIEVVVPTPTPNSPGAGLPATPPPMPSPIFPSPPPNPGAGGGAGLATPPPIPSVTPNPTPQPTPTPTPPPNPGTIPDETDGTEVEDTAVTPDETEVGEDTDGTDEDNTGSGEESGTTPTHHELRITITPPQGGNVNDITIITPQSWTHTTTPQSNGTYLLTIFPSTPTQPTPNPTPTPSPTPTPTPALPEGRLIVDARNIQFGSHSSVDISHENPTALASWQWTANTNTANEIVIIVFIPPAATSNDIFVHEPSEESGWTFNRNPNPSNNSVTLTFTPPAPPVIPDVLQISTAQDWENFANMTAAERNNFERVELMNDISITNTVVPSFGGIFEGNGRTINTTITTSNSDFGGLFADIETGGIVRNVHVVAAISNTNNVGVGGIAFMSRGLIENVAVTGQITSNIEDVGGIVGLNSGTINRVFVDATIYARGVGAIASLNNNNGVIRNSFSSGRITNNSLGVGGIVRLNFGVIENTFSTATITHNGDIGGVGGGGVGGIVAHVMTGNLTVNNVALNPNIMGPGPNIGRIIGTNTPISTNYAHQGVLVNSLPIPQDSPPTTQNGQTVTTAEMTQSWWESLGFTAANGWQFVLPNIPTLANLPASVVQNPQLSGIINDVSLELPILPPIEEEEPEEEAEESDEDETEDSETDEADEFDEGSEYDEDNGNIDEDDNNIIEETDTEETEIEEDEVHTKEPEPEPDVVLGEPEPESEPDEHPEDSYKDYDNEYKDLIEDTDGVEEDGSENGEDLELETAGDLEEIDDILDGLGL